MKNNGFHKLLALLLALVMVLSLAACGNKTQGGDTGNDANVVTDGAYWAFYINGEYASTGVDATNIEAGAAYALKAEQAAG